jgi:hypothetical protein
MPLVVFTNPETASKYESLTEYDLKLDVPCRRGEGQCYRGLLSNIDPAAAARYVRFGGNLLKEKTITVIKKNTTTETD